jgi:L-lactate dehydrogenase complex protein LldG
MNKQELFATFKAKAEAVSTEIHSAADMGAAIEIIKQVANGLKVEGEVGKILWLKGELSKDIDLEKLELGTIYTDNFRENAPDGMIGINEMDYAIADTGTVCMDAYDVNKRLVSTLPTLHVALIKAGNVLPDMLSALEKYYPNVPGQLAFITGPSRTSDIERVLTIGVHGPRRLVVIFVGQEGGRE